jgi:putative transposase
MIDVNCNLSLIRQSEVLSLPRSSLYYKANKINDDTWVMNEIQELWMKLPFYGYRRITAALNRSGYGVNHKRVYRLMRKMNLAAIYPKRTTFSNKEYLKYPYLLGDLDITHPNHVWSTDLTYLKMQKGFLYLVALIDVFSRLILSWRLSISMDTEFCISMLEDGLSKGAPKIINTDQGVQFTSNMWTEKLLQNEIKISMDGKGRCLDNVYIERFWRSLKQEEVYLKPYDSVSEAEDGIRKYIEFYNHQRPHQSLDYRTPAEVYFAGSVDLALVLHKKKVA